MQASQQNRARIAALPPRQRAPPPRPGAEVRERAIAFAQTGVPKPSSFRARGQLGVEVAAAAAVQAVPEVNGSGVPAEAAGPPVAEAGAPRADQAAAPAGEDCDAAAASDMAGRLQALHLDCAPAECQQTDAVPSSAGSPELPAGC